MVGKTITYSMYGKQYQQAAASNRGRTFSVCPNSVYYGNTFIYNGYGDLFEYANYNNPRLSYSSSTGGQGAAAGRQCLTWT